MIPPSQGHLHSNADVALELLPARRRVEVALGQAKDAHARSSAAKALTVARDAIEMAGPKAPLAEAQARLFAAIALRRLGKNNEAVQEYLRCAELLADRMDEAGAPELQVDLLLDQAIFSFLREDYSESARKNERAARLALDLGRDAQSARAWLNAGVSWDRLNEVAEAERCFGLCGTTLAKLESSSLHQSYELFRWRRSIDFGPLALGAPLSSGRTQSQESLHLLYSWEFALATAAPSEVELVRDRFLGHLSRIQERQFESERQSLQEISEFLYQGKVHPVSGGVGEIAAQGRIPMVAASIQHLFVHGRWKRLESFCQSARESRHPALRAWGLRGACWNLWRLGDRVQALELHAEARRLARENGMNQLLSELQFESDLAGGTAVSLAEFAPQPRKVFQKLAEYLLPRAATVLRISNSARAEIGPDSACEDLDSALRDPRSAGHLLIDGVRSFARLAVSKKSRIPELIHLDRMPMQRKILFALLAAFPQAVSKEELVNVVWDEVYNPIIHDTTLYRAISRLKKLLQGGSRNENPWLSFESGNLRLTPGSRPFLAMIPEQEVERRQARLNERQIRILTLLKYRGRLKRSEAVSAIGAPERTLARDLAVLTQRKMILRTGMGRGAFYLPAV